MVSKGPILLHLPSGGDPIQITQTSPTPRRLEKILATSQCCRPIDKKSRYHEEIVAKMYTVVLMLVLYP